MRATVFKPSSLVLRSFLSVSLFSMLSACTVVEKTVIKNPAIDEEMGAPGTIIVKNNGNSDELTSAAEQLMSPYTFHLADQIFAQALGKDSNNLKAKTYRAILKPLMVNRGIMTRIKPYIRANGNILQHENSIKDLPTSPMRDFLLVGSEDIATVKDVQDFLIRQRDAFFELNQFLKKNVSQINFDIYLNPHIFQDEIQDEFKKSCKVVNTTEQMEVTCDFSEIALKRFSTPDVVVLQQMAAGYALMYDFYLSYSYEGLETISKELSDESLTPSQKQALIESVGTLGLLRKDQSLNRMLLYGSDLLTAAEWAIKFQSRLCPKGKDQINLPKHLVENGICIDSNDETKRSLALLKAATKGLVSLDATLSNGQTAKVDVNAFKFLNAPPSDLRGVAPSSYAPCGEAGSLRDKTFGGLFPNGDAELVMLTSCK